MRKRNRWSQCRPRHLRVKFYGIINLVHLFRYMLRPPFGAARPYPGSMLVTSFPRSSTASVSLVSAFAAPHALQAFYKQLFRIGTRSSRVIRTYRLPGPFLGLVTALYRRPS